MKTSLLVIVAAAGAAACGGGTKSAPPPAKPVEVAPAPPPPPPPPPPTEREQKVVDRFLECMRPTNMKDLSGIAACYSDDAVVTGPVEPPKTVGGKETAEKFYKPFFDAFPDLQLRAPVILANHNNLAVVMHAYGMNSGKLMGQRGSGRTMGLNGIRFVEMPEDKITKEAHIFDPATMMAQLGKLKLPARKMTAPPPGEPVVVLATDSKTESANVDVVKQICNAFSKQDAAAIAALMADDVEWSDQTSAADLQGKAAVEGELKAIFAAFPDINISSCDAWGAGDFVANRAQWTATNKGAWKEIGIAKATNKSLAVEDGEIYQIVDGKVKKYWRFSNGMSMAAQLGLLPKKK